MPAVPTLGRQMLATLDNIQDLIEVTHDEQRLKELENQRTQLIKTIGQLVDTNLDSATQQYKDSTSALRDASKTVKDAIKGVESVADAIKAVGEALDLVTELIP
jgi:hypothetical protein